MKTFEEVAAAWEVEDQRTDRQKALTLLINEYEKAVMTYCHHEARVFGVNDGPADPGANEDADKAADELAYLQDLLFAVTVGPDDGGEPTVESEAALLEWAKAQP